MSILILHDRDAAPRPVLSGLVALYRMDEAGGQVVADSSGNGRDGVLGADDQAGSDDPTWANGGLEFDGGDHVAL